MKKQCRVCKQIKPLGVGFNRNKGTKDGYLNICKICDNLQKKIWYQENLEREREKRKRWQEDNYELHLEHQKKYNRSPKGREAAKRYREKTRAPA